MAALTGVFSDVVHEQDLLTADLVAGRDVRAHWARMTMLMTACAAIYGAVLGSWHGPTLALYVSIKLPLMLLITSSLTMVFNWMIALAFGLRLKFNQVGALTFLGLTTASVLLASLAPVAALFTLCAPPPTTAARTAHNLLYLMHTGSVAVCGLRGSVALWIALRATSSTLRTGTRALPIVYGAWLLAFAIVGGEVAWALRPFVGSVSADFPVVFLRPDALDGNVYEFILRDIFPYLLGAD